MVINMSHNHEEMAASFFIIFHLVKYLSVMSNPSFCFDLMLLLCSGRHIFVGCFVGGLGL